jgi:hypothetical protein
MPQEKFARDELGMNFFKFLGSSSQASRLGSLRRKLPNSFLHDGRKLLGRSDRDARFRF